MTTKVTLEGWGTKNPRKFKCPMCRTGYLLEGFEHSWKGLFGLNFKDAYKIVFYCDNCRFKRGVQLE